jgi:hypothetical protein
MAAVWLKVRVDVVPVEPGSDVPEPDATAAAQEAVFNALKAAEKDGFDHERSDSFSLTVDYVQAIDFDPTV